MNKIIIIIFSIFISFSSLAQNFTISGNVSDSKTGEAVIGAVIGVKEKNIGTNSNVYGFYSLSLPKGSYEIVYNFVGFKTITQNIELNSDIKNNVELSENSEELDEVIVNGVASDKNVKSAETGVSLINTKELSLVPVLFGEQDILKTIQLLPGIKSAGEGNSGFYVRGGGADENLILLDEAPVYNASHLLGFFSVFNSDAVKSAKLYKGTAPAEYGGRLSSVLDINMNDGNSKNFSASGGIGLISSRLTIEGPIKKDKASFIVSARRTYADLFLVFAKKEETRNSILYFYDLNGKINWKINDNNRIFLSGYYGRDVFSFNDMMKMDWGNATGTARWNHVFNNKLFLNSSFIYSKYNYAIGFGLDEGEIKIGSAIEDWNLKEDFQYFINSKNTLKFGLNGIYHTFLPGEVTATDIPGVNDIKVDEKFALESAAYISHEFEINKNLNLIYGVRYSMLNAVGPATSYIFDEFKNPIDSTVYVKGEFYKTYQGFEPRVNINYVINKNNSIKISYTRNRQYVHLLSSSTSSSPTDVWYPATTAVKPGISDLYSAGYYKNFNDNMFETSVEFYYKDLQNLIDYRNGANVVVNPYLEAELVFGKGWSYGAEFYIKKSYGKFSGWISYTWSKTERQFDDINEGKPFSARQDRTNDFSITGIYNLNKRLSFAATWVYYNGDAVTFPSGRYFVDGYPVFLYTERNGYRMPDYHRGDVSITIKNKEKKNWESSWNLSVYNVYARKNAYTITFEPKEDTPEQFEAVRLALFSIIPSITYNFRFR